LLNIASTLVGAFLLPYICGIQKTIIMTSKKEIQIRDITFKGKSSRGSYSIYEIETYEPINMMAIDHIIVERDIIAETLENWMNDNKVKPSDALEFLNKNYKL